MVWKLSKEKRSQIQKRIWQNPEYRKHMSEIHKGQMTGHKWKKGDKIKHDKQFKKNHIPWNKNLKGIHLSPKTEYKKGIKIDIKCNYCGKDKKINPCIFKKNKLFYCNRICQGKYRTGLNNPNYIDGRSNIPYPNEFKNIRRNKIIQKRDNFTCQLCGDFIPINKGINRLELHHIDYNKNNNRLNNLITLCHFCNLSVNNKREDWINYFQNKLNGFGI